MRLLWSVVLLCGALGARAQEEVPIGAPQPEGSLVVPEASVVKEVETLVEETTHDVIVANTLWDLSEHYYKDPWLWPRIYEANKEIIQDPHWIYPGQQFMIPGLGRTVTVVHSLPEPTPEPEPEPEPGAQPEPAPEPEPAEPPPPPDGDVYRLSETIPDGMVASGPSARLKLVPADWSADGEVEGVAGEALGIVGDLIEFKGNREFKMGERLKVYRKGERFKKDGEAVMFLQPVADVKVKSVDGRTVRASIERSADAVSPGDLVKGE